MKLRFIHLLFVALCGLLGTALVSVTVEPARRTALAGIVSSATLHAQEPAAAQGAFVGDDTCTACHETIGRTIASSSHGKAANPRTPAAQPNRSCESCHGPGQKHAESGDPSDIRVFRAMAARDASAVCLTCHNRGNHAAWEGSTHEARNLTCTTCHSAHDARSFQQQLIKETETQLCATCHRPQVVKTERAVAHMPVREGKLSCSSCHNPHGSIANVKALKVGNSVNESCTGCHAEMRGPMLFEHTPVRENCTTCHDPHGSSNDRMLNVRMPMLCQRCHVATRHPSSVYDNAAITTNKSNRMFGRSCVNCHSNVHGSNHPSGQFFMR
jgi:DmsE family decaheme c-type cytochrome